MLFPENLILFTFSSVLKPDKGFWGKKSWEFFFLSIIPNEHSNTYQWFKGVNFFDFVSTKAKVSEVGTAL